MVSVSAATGGNERGFFLQLAQLHRLPWFVSLNNIHPTQSFCHNFPNYLEVVESGNWVFMTISITVPER